MRDELAVLIKEIKLLPEKIGNKALNKASLEVAREIRNEARKLVPVRTGLLRTHILAVKSKAPKGIFKSSVIVRRYKKLTKTLIKRRAKGQKISTFRDKSDAYYAVFVEHGTKNIKGKFFLQRALNKVLPRMEEIANKNLSNFLKEQKWS